MFLVTPHAFTIEPNAPLLVFRHSLNELVQAIEENSIVLSWIVRQATGKFFSPFKKGANRFFAQLARPRTVAELFQVAGIQVLLKLTFDGNRKHWDSKADGLAHERKPATANDCSRGSQVIQKTFA